MIRLDRSEYGNGSSLLFRLGRWELEATTTRLTPRNVAAGRALGWRVKRLGPVIVILAHWPH